MKLELLIAALGPAEVVNEAQSGSAQAQSARNDSALNDCAQTDDAPFASARLEVSELAFDTRRVTPGALFFCVRGRHSDGHAHAAEAAARGAVALVVERRLELALPQLVVADVRAAMPQAATLFFGDPSRELELAGVTGTNGKTTTAFLLHAILAAAGRSCGLLTNIERRVGGAARPTGLNTPEAIDLQRLLREMVEAGDSACVLEASSEAQAQGRLEGTRFAVLVFTNLTQDHLNFHGTMEAYFAAKAALFAQARHAVVNVGDPYGARLAASLPGATTFDARSEALAGIELKLRGGFNRENAIGAALAARALGLDEQAIRRGIESLAGVPGRFESIEEGQGFAVIVDYAHTPEALERVLGEARSLGEGRLIVVFGAGGERDHAKRPLMGAAVAGLADRAIVTSDNPRGEEPEAIAAQVVAGAAALELELDRRRAIEQALGGARPGDVVVIAGRGAEPEQELAGGVRLRFDDREVARELLRAVGAPR